MSSPTVNTTLYLAIGSIITTLVITAAVLGKKSIVQFLETKCSAKIGETIKVLTREPKEYPLKEKISVSHDTFIFRFALPHVNCILGLPIGKHIRISCPNTQGKVTGKWNNQNDSESSATIDRKYTPISLDTPGHFDLLVKIYLPNQKFQDGGKMSRYLNSLSIGDKISVSGPYGLTEYCGNGNLMHAKRSLTCSRIGMICGGSGVTPMYQILSAALFDENDCTQFYLIYANQTPLDILMRQELDDLQKRFPQKLQVWYTVDRVDTNDAWKYDVGYVTKEMIQQHMDILADDSVVLLCGPPPMLKFACLPNLTEIGWKNTQIIEF